MNFKTLKQLSAMDEETSEGLLFTVHFGKFYMLDADRCFDRQRGAISCADIESAVGGGKRNRLFGQSLPAFDPSSAVRDDKAALIPKASKPAPPPPNGQGGSNGGSDRWTSKDESSEKSSKTKNVSSSFWSSIPMESEGQMEIIHNRIISIVESLGYKQVAYFSEDDSDTGKVNRDFSSGKVPGTSIWLPGAQNWKIEVTPSPSYSAHLTTARPTSRPSSKQQAEAATAAEGDDGGNPNPSLSTPPLEVKERFLSWVHGTLLSAKEESAEVKEGGHEAASRFNSLESFRHHDLRFKVGNNKTVEVGTDLYCSVCPQGELPVQFDEASGRPVPRTDGLLKDQVAFVRRIKKRFVFANSALVEHLHSVQTNGSRKESNNDNNTEAVKILLILAEGIHYEGVGLKEESPFVDLSLDGDMSEVAKWVEGKGSGHMDKAAQSLSETIGEVMRVSEMIRERW